MISSIRLGTKMQVNAEAAIGQPYGTMLELRGRRLVVIQEDLEDLSTGLLLCAIVVPLN
jgi:hypothetical protein